MTQIVTPKGADGHAVTIKGGAAAAPRPEVRPTQSSTKESEDLRTTLTKAKQEQITDFLDLNLGTQKERDYQRYVSKWELYSKLFMTIRSIPAGRSPTPRRAHTPFPLGIASAS
jgi:hypothetical protein